MAKSKSMLNNNLGGDQIVYLENDEVSNVEKAQLQTYNVSATNVTVDELVNTVYDNFNNSKKRKLMLEGISYYNNDSDIDKKVRYDHCGSRSKQNNKLSNAKMHKNFMRKLTRQKVTYLLGKPFSIDTDNEEYKKILEEEYFDKYMYRLVFNLLKEAIKEGINWINVYYNEEGKLCFRRIPGNQVKPFWADREHTKLSQLIHYYEIEVFEGSETKNVVYADYYSTSGVIHYIKKDEGFVRDSERPTEEGNFTLYVPETEDKVDKDGKIIEIVPKLDEDGNPILKPQQMVWDKLPWIPLKYNEEETSLLKYIKPDQDEYEKLISAIVDIIIDIPDAIKVFKGYGGADLEELTEKIAQFRAVLVDIDGDVSSLDTKFDITASSSLLDRIRKDAYEDGAGVDMQSDNTGDKSGVGLKFLYSDLDLDSEELEQELNTFFEWLLWFIDFDINLKSNADYFEEEVTFSYNRTLIINESEQIDMINNSRDMLPDSVLLPKHPFVEDVTEVEEAIEKQLEEEMKRYGNQPFGNNQNNNVANNQIPNNQNQTQNQNNE